MSPGRAPIWGIGRRTRRTITSITRDAARWRWNGEGVVCGFNEDRDINFGLQSPEPKRPEGALAIRVITAEPKPLSSDAQSRCVPTRCCRRRVLGLDRSRRPKRGRLRRAVDVVCGGNLLLAGVYGQVSDRRRGWRARELRIYQRSLGLGLPVGQRAGADAVREHQLAPGRFPAKVLEAAGTVRRLLGIRAITGSARRNLLRCVRHLPNSVWRGPVYGRRCRYQRLSLPHPSPDHT